MLGVDLSKPIEISLHAREKMLDRGASESEIDMAILDKQRRAYGYRDKTYMKLKIIQSCALWMGRFRPWDCVHNFPS